MASRTLFVTTGDRYNFRDKARMTERVNVDIAASTQRIFEMTMQAALEVFQRVLEKLGRPGLPLCYAGGTALNCPANTLMAGRTGFASMHIPPWCDDSGLSLGAALALYHNVLDQPLPADAGPRKDVDAYLGAAPIAEALAAGARIVVTGRVADASLTLGPAAYEFGWAWDDWDRLAAGSVAGHLIECGAQVTGGYLSDWQGLDLAHVAGERGR